MINIAMPKGRLGETAYELFAAAGRSCPEAVEGSSRKLVFENTACGVRYFWVKPSDVAIYVERGAADLGVVGKDILLEAQPAVYELMDLGIGRCVVAVAAPRGFRDDMGRSLKVATKFPNIAREYYLRQSRQITIIKLNGSIELAPILGLSDVIVDLVETGKTLRENDLEVIGQVADISARLIANEVSFRFKRGELEDVCGALASVVRERGGL